MDEDRLTPRLGRMIDAAKKAAAGAAPAAGARPADAPRAGRAEGWAILGLDGEIYPGKRLVEALAAARDAGAGPEAGAFAVAGETGETVLPAAGWREGAEDADPQLPIAVKYLGRWVLVTLEEIPEGRT